jgi:hypothetical protein
MEDRLFFSPSVRTSLECGRVMLGWYTT